jgi:HSP20 family protein
VSQRTRNPFDGLLRGLGSLIDAAADIADRTEQEPVSSDTARTAVVSRSARGLHAVYGVSVRVGARGVPVVAPFGNVRQNRRREPVVADAREPMADLFDEEDHYVIVAELPGATEADVKWNVEGQRLIIRADAGDRKYYRVIDLAAAIDVHTAVRSYENGVLELKLWKEQR